MTNNEQNQQSSSGVNGGVNSAVGAQGYNAAGQSGDNSQKLNEEIRKAWPNLSDEDVKLYSTQQGTFFDRLNEKQGVGRDEARKRIEEMKASCQSCSAGSMNSQSGNNQSGNNQSGNSQSSGSNQAV